MNDTRSHEGTTPEGVEKREAIYALGGYLYQAITAALAWVRLPNNATLYLEVADDYSTLINHTLFAHQVKASPRTVTLNDSGVKTTIENVVQLVAKNPGLEVQQYFHTTGNIGWEHALIDRLPDLEGLHYWHAAAQGRVPLRPLRDWLESDRMPGPVRVFCRDRTDAELKTQLIDRVHWLTGKTTYEGMIRELEDALVLRVRNDMQLPAQTAATLVDTVLYRVLTTSVLSERQLRRLNAADLLRVIDLHTHATVPLAHLRLQPQIAGTGWEPVAFNLSRGWLSILRGEKLLPGDALTCPPIPEVDVVLDALSQRWCQSIFGQPGSGKSIAAYQVVHRYRERGWRVVQHFGDSPPVVERSHPDQTLYLVDDAHLLPRGALHSLVASSSDRAHVLLLHNALQYDAIESDRDAILLDTRRAVRTIADYFIAHQEAMTPVVRELDQLVGFRMVDISLDRRIAEAFRKATYPWQFCFILSGGARRAIEAVEKACTSQTHFTFAAVALHQLVSRDASPTENTIKSLLAAAQLPTQRVSQHLTSLVRARWLVDGEDLRLPHQRFAASCLALLADHDDENIRRPISTIICAALADPQWPLHGKAMVLEELHRTRRFRGQWATALEPALSGCWLADTDHDIEAAATFLRHIDQYLEDKGAATISANESTLVEWMNRVSPATGVALGFLVNDIGARDRALVTRLIERSDPEAVATLLRQAAPDNGGTIGHYLLSMSFVAQTPWRDRLRTHIARSDLIEAASRWRGTGKSENSDLYALSSLSHLCYGLCWIDENLCYELLAAAMPFAQRVFADRTAEALSCYSDVCNFVLRFSELFERAPEFQPEPWHTTTAYQFTEQVDSRRTAAQLSSALLNHYQRSAELLRFLRMTNRDLFTKIVVAMDWDAVIYRMALHGNNPPMDVEHLLAMACCEETAPTLQAAAAPWIATLDALPARLAVMFPDLAWAHVLAGKMIQLTRHWPSGAGVIAAAAEEHPELLPSILEPHRNTITRALVASSGGADTGFGMFLEYLINASPDFWSSVLQELDISHIAPVWRGHLASPGNDNSLTAFIVQRCQDHPGAVGDLARELALDFALQATPVKPPELSEGTAP